MKSKINYFFCIQNKKCFYKILNVSTFASIEEIKQSYHKLVKIHHPDVS